MSSDNRDRIDRIRRNQSLPDLLLAHGVKLQQRGQEYSACCIAHDDRNPSMSVFQTDTGWRAYCHACGFSEDVIGTYMHLSGDDFLPSLDALDGGQIHTGKPYATIADEPRPVKPQRTVTIPPEGSIPPYARAMTKVGDEWVSLGDPVQTWCFRTTDGKPWYYEARYEITDEETGEIRKEPRIWTWGNRGEQPARWECAHHPVPRPLYGLNELHDAAQVLICEGPKKAEAARMMLNGTKAVACVGWAGGSNGVSRSDWSAIEGKPVLIMPDSDEAGYNALNAIAEQLAGKVPSIHYIQTWDMPHTWDAADAQADGWDKQRFLAFLKERKTEYVAPVEPEPEPLPYDQPPIVPPEPPPVGAQSPDDYIQWSEPLDIFSDMSVPSIQPHQLPTSIAAWVQDVSGVIGVDTSMLALPAIVACASVLHDAIQLQPEAHNPGWKESARLWGALIGDPSSKKSPAMSKVLGIIKKIDSECHEQESRARYEYSLQEKAHAANEKSYIERVSKGEKNLPLPTKPEMPEIPRPYAQDFTIEALRDILKHSSRGILAERDELSGWFGSMDQYKSGGRGGADRASWLEVYNGGARRIERVGAGSIFVKNWSASIIGGIQPEPLRAIAANINEDGLLQRFMVCYGKPGAPGNEQPPNKAIDDQYRRIVRQIWDTAPHPDPVTLSPEANEVRRQIVKKAYDLIGIQFVSNSMVAHLGKWEGLSARLMLTFHAIDCAVLSVHPQSCQINEKTAETVRAFMLEFLLPHATKFYMDILTGSETAKHLHSIANLILVKHPHEITLRDMTRGWVGWRHAADSVQYQVINRLIDAGWIQPPLDSRISANRKIHTRYLVNPQLGPMYFDRAEMERKRRDEARSLIETMRAENNGIRQK